MTARARIKSALHGLYQRHPGNVHGVCAYCGDKADSQDHVPPLAAVYALGDVPTKHKLWLVLACRECNSVLSDQALMTVGARKRFLIRYYRRKYAALLRMPRWTEAELDELKGVLREDVSRHWHLARFQRARMERLMGRRYGKHSQEETSDGKPEPRP